MSVEPITEYWEHELFPRLQEATTELQQTQLLEYLKKPPLDPEFVPTIISIGLQLEASSMVEVMQQIEPPPEIRQIHLKDWFMFPLNLVFTGEQAHKQFGTQLRDFPTQDSPEKRQFIALLFGRLGYLYAQDPTGLAIVQYVLEDPVPLSLRKNEDYLKIIEDIVQHGGNRFKAYHQLLTSNN